MLFLQRAGKLRVWEEVDKYTWSNWDKAIDKDGPRYNGNRVSKTGDGIDIQCANITSADAAIIMRFLAIKGNEAPGSVEGGFVRTPEFVRFKGRGNKVILHEMNGSDYVCRQNPERQEVLEETA